MFLKWACLIILISINSSFSKNCGVRKIKTVGRIVGGRMATKNEFPWTVALEYRQNSEYFHMCGAAVLNDRWIITAAHCLHRRNTNGIRAVLGTNELQKSNANKFITTFEKSVSHESFEYGTYQNDIALLKTTRKIPSFSENESINKICLPEENQIFSGLAYVSGWGRVEEDGDISDSLRVVGVGLFNDSQCKSFWKESFYESQMLCAGYTRGGKDSCNGDSGGPLERVINNKAYLIGIVSFGRGCARKQLPGVYTEVSRFVNWIKRKMEEKENPTKPIISLTTSKPTTRKLINRASTRLLSLRLTTDKPFTRFPRTRRPIFKHFVRNHIQKNIKISHHFRNSNRQLHLGTKTSTSIRCVNGKCRKTSKTWRY